MLTKPIKLTLENCQPNKLTPDSHPMNVQTKTKTQTHPKPPPQFVEQHCEKQCPSELSKEGGAVAADDPKGAVTQQPTATSSTTTTTSPTMMMTVVVLKNDATAATALQDITDSGELLNPRSINDTR